MKLKFDFITGRFGFYDLLAGKTGTCRFGFYDLAGRKKGNLRLTGIKIELVE